MLHSLEEDDRTRLLASARTLLEAWDNGQDQPKLVEPAVVHPF